MYCWGSVGINGFCKKNISSLICQCLQGLCVLNPWFYTRKTYWKTVLEIHRGRWNNIFIGFYRYVCLPTDTSVASCDQSRWIFFAFRAFFCLNMSHFGIGKNHLERSFLQEKQSWSYVEPNVGASLPIAWKTIWPTHVIDSEAKYQMWILPKTYLDQDVFS